MSDPILQAKRWWWQRVSAMALALFVLVHLGGMVWAVRGGLTGQEILDRTRGSVTVAAFYGAFVLACAVHVPIGLARIAEEWAGWTEARAVLAARAFGVVLLVMGLRAVYAVVAA